MQKQVTRFSAIEQKLVNTGDLLDRELGRFKSIQSYNKEAIQATSLDELASITVESIVEVFEVECGAIFTYDATNNSLAIVENYGLEEKHPLVMDWIVSEDIINAKEGVFIEGSKPSKPWGSLGLCQVIYAPYYKNGKLHGFVLGGITTKKKDFYDTIDEEIKPSFRVFVQQMDALRYNIESREIIRHNISELTISNEQLQREIKQRERTEDRIKRMNKCFLNFGADPLENINSLTALFGELMGATCALYNRLDDGILYSWGQWKTPTDYNPLDEPEGHICYDVIQRADNHLMVVRNLSETAYAQTDPNVIPYALKTYIGTGVKLGESFVGSLCCVFQKDIVPTKEDKWMIGVIATAIAVEEKRKWVQEELVKSDNKYRMIFENSPVGIFHYDQDGIITHCNSSFARIIGPPAEKIIGVNILDSKTNAHVSEVVKETLSKNTGSFEGEYISVISGKKTQIKAEARSVFSNNGSPLGGICVVEDITKQKKAEMALKGRDAILEAVSFAAEKLLGPYPLEDAIQTVLERLGQATNIDQAYIFKNVVGEDGILRAYQTNQWKITGINDLNDSFEPHRISYTEDDYERWIKILKAGNVIAGPIHEFPEIEYPILKACKALSIAAVPIQVEENWWGFICFNDCTNEREWFTVEKDALKAAADAIGAAIQRNRAEEVLQENEEKVKSILASIQTGVVIIDAETHMIVDANPSAVQSIGAPKQEIVGKVCHKFICTAEKGECPISDLKQNIDRSERVLLNVKGEEIPILKNVASVNLNGRLHLIESFIDITERKQAEEVQKKDILLKEIHHRVKNNLQVISSLLNLQSRNFNDEKVIAAFMESQNRVRSMAIAHQKLYQSNDLASIEVGDYIKNLTTYLFQTYRVGNRAIKLKLDIDNVYMGIEKTIPLGLIINELVSNSLKHAYKSEKKGEINIKFHLENNVITLIVSDNGEGIPEYLDYKNTHSLGLQLVTTLVKQIHGNIELDRSNGTKFVITFEY
ncbi:histidine kinase dimerization/phosphoacceptor domain -containing protein [Methanococcoides burtonii]|uniref:GAF-containing Multisensor signal transduction histidine kinase n=1 Tax=Methanococcoides burtonii (strain DSM 6242 / NBRC 107633 / OCM 468 / ACE-M) TaxID=259564 RepID=Q12XG8_METBU|nr:histidine kinase dimerization/phosphoacceptor domain -containing protein [Methanococcoides burtonii]ABE51858.1 GAF-containing Multisensor signal transduction histidine kinase [Methanococcoides burtonii DSM 6242]